MIYPTAAATADRLGSHDREWPARHAAGRVDPSSLADRSPTPDCAGSGGVPGASISVAHGEFDTGAAEPCPPHTSY